MFEPKSFDNQAVSVYIEFIGVIIEVKRVAKLIATLLLFINSN